MVEKTRCLVHQTPRVKSELLQRANELEFLTCHKLMHIESSRLPPLEAPVMTAEKRKLFLFCFFLCTWRVKQHC